MSADFVCLRITSMLDVDITLFQFDWDQTWAGFFMNAQGYIYARYGTRKEQNGENSVSLAGLKETMKKSLELHKKEFAKAPPAWKPMNVEDLPSFKKDPQAPKGCAHCHHAWTYTRKNEMDLGKWKREKLYVYPLAENLGITLDLDRNTVVKDAAGMAQKAGVQPDDKILAVNGQRVLTPADISFILNGIQTGTVKLDLDRGGSPATASMSVSGDWRKRDLSWRESVNVLSPQAGFWAPALPDAERPKFGLAADAIALRVKMLTPTGGAKAAGMMVDDIIIAVDGQTKNMTTGDLTQHIWMDLNPGSVLKLVVLRGKKQIPINVLVK
jgi:hypothetical protein